ncbi:helicase-exonuclease AddAB subunit AddA [Sutcliffiella rhizosphaerae]|uniref:ATP-dependent helicase/nuclease subunit A n=1 Tax=Sutcliffiella rhizosphaerae TaxID=2880967 RepID=A0ABM8YSP1_9BACI|nr:helicase-exonuclease AddAB subunit AddA [Sutcliffiella rhizosphaerae]CAG9622982.1 ATP-dependent helicase/nuclease subunit A [Sutcliffiella rhizosphaerae]
MTMELLPKPEGTQWTDDQWKAIVSSGRDMLVAAAAGSGKTAVLVERMIHKIVQEHVDVDRLLVVTFTNASAAEMRHRIGEALEKELIKKPASLHLRRQLSLLNRASISTIHSFCLEVIRKYYYLIDIDPGFRIADTTEIQLMQEEVLEEIFEEEYGKDNNELFFDLVDRYTSDGSDHALQDLVLKLYEFSRANPEPELWLEEIVQFYQTSNQHLMDDLPFVTMLKEEIKLQFHAAFSLLEKARDLTLQPGGPTPRSENVEQDLAQLNKLRTGLNTSWTHLYTAMQEIDFPRAKTCRGDEYDKELIEKWTKVRNQAKGIVQGIKEELFTRRPESFMKDLEDLAPLMKTLVNLVKNYGQVFYKLKQEKGLVDFSDLEHLCLGILRVKFDNRWNRSEAALKYQTTFKEVMVDEYQDTNLVQEAILKLVTHETEEVGNMFMVGDVKQSIYRFRLAEPFLFLDKYKRFNTTGDKTGLRIDLNQNFRSRPEVLDATNYIFKQIMGESVGEIEYDTDAELKFGATYYPKAPNREAELLLVDRSDTSNDELESEGEQNEVEHVAVFDKTELETAQVEAKLIAQRIKNLIQSSYEVYDKDRKEMRPVTYRDFVILMRSMPWAPQFMEEFKQQGIPIYANMSTGYFEATEVAILLSVLKIIDNPYQDVPLASVLRSPIVGLDSNDLAVIRIQQKKGSYFEALLLFLKRTPSTEEEHNVFKRVLDFYELLQTWRTKAREGALSELIWKIYQDTHFYDFVGGMPGGKQRQANLRALYDRARQYESTSFRGLFRFLRFIERMQDRGEDLGAARALGEQEDVVRLMTIHSSKGLEFPIVFVAGLSKQFNMMDLRSSYLMDKELGFGTRFVNPSLRITYPTILQIALKQKAKAELIAEEMRVLYVALTRAKEKLYLVGTLKDYEKSVLEWKENTSHGDWLLPDYLRANAKSYMDWIGPSLIRYQDASLFWDSENTEELIHEEISNHQAKWKVSVTRIQQLLEEMEAEKEEEDEWLRRVEAGLFVDMESSFKEKVKEQLYWQYPHHLASTQRSKQSVSELKRMREHQDPYADNQLLQKGKKLFLDRPAFLQKQKLSPSEIGTAMHTVMQNIDLSNEEMTREFIQSQIQTMLQNEKITKEQAEVIDFDALLSFFLSDIGKRLLKAKNVHREVPFSLGIDGEELMDEENLHKETVLVQGVVDCLFEDEEGFVLIDYKTDTVTSRYPEEIQEVEQRLRNRYYEQLALYGRAVEQIWKKKLTAKYLFFFDGNHVIEID